MNYIYGIFHKLTNKVYVGSSVNLKQRWKDHRNHLNRGDHNNEYFQRAWNKYGADAFEWKILEDVLSKTKLIEREQYWLDFYKSYLPENGYNINPKAYSLLGFKHTKSELITMSLGQSGRKFTLKHRKNISKAMTGKTRGSMSELTKQKIALKALGNKRALGLKHTQKTKSLLRKLAKKRWVLK